MSYKEMLLKNKKPMEIYFFIDPFCSECWSVSPILKRLQMEYGDYFSLKYILSGNLSSLNKRNWKRQNGKLISNNRKSTEKFEDPPHLAAISIKAAELQGKRAGIKFIQRLQEMLFIENQDISDINILQKCAKHIGLDLEEFIRDVYSESASKAFQCDLKISSEMGVDEMPSMVFFNENIEDEGIKITGLYNYEVYVQILTEMFHDYPKPAEKLPLELFLAQSPINTAHDLAIIYDLPVQKIERFMKKLQLQQKAERIHTRHGTFWKYNFTGI